MATKKKLLQAAAGVGGGEALNIEDVFSTYLYEGDGTSSHTITNGVDYTEEDYLVWIKDREYSAGGGEAHQLYDTVRGATKILVSNTSGAEYTESYGLKTFNNNGFTLGQSNAVNRSGSDIVAWSFRKAPKFFDVVTYTGNGTAGRTISHNLGTTVGALIVKCTSAAKQWFVWHRGLSNAGNSWISLNGTTAEASSTSLWNSTIPSDSVFTLGSNVNTNESGQTYVAYLFAHNDGDGEFGPDGDADIIKCGSYTGGNGTDVSVDLGFEPQWVMVKKSSGSANWVIADNMRGISSFSSGNNTKELEPNTSDAESFNEGIRLNPNGFTAFSNQGQWNGNGTYIYIAIRRGPMAVPESADDVFDIATRDATEPHFNSNFDTVDFALYRSNISGTADWFAATRLMTPQILRANTTGGEVSGGTGFVMDFSGGWYGNSSANSSSYSWMWKRAHGYFDTVAYKGSGTARTIGHNLGVVPEMIWVKIRSTSGEWSVYHKDVGNDKRLQLNDTVAAQGPNSYWNNTTPTDSVFSIGAVNSLNQLNHQFMAYLFASVDGVSKVGSYTGDGTTDGSNVVDCGFTNGARFILVKMADGTSNWGVFDTERGIVSGNDSRMFLDTTAAQLTTIDFLVPNSSGFAFKNGFNSTGFTYIFYAIAA